MFHQISNHVKIVATVGPASNSPDAVEALALAGVNVFRLNFSHGTRDEHATTFHRIREIGQRLDLALAVLADLQGPKIRTGALAGGQSVLLRRGDSFAITTQQVEGTAQRVSTDFHELPRHVAIGQRLLLDDGRLAVTVVQVTETDVVCEVVYGGMLGEHKGINLPGTLVDIPPLTDKDIADLAFCLDLGVDYIAMSFVQRASDIRIARQIMRDMRRARVPIIAKIEKRQALENLDAILQAFDGVMVARGDLGVETSPEEVPAWQKRIIQRANAAEKVVITATQMLESMVGSPRPTRAEASDVANAVWDGTDAVMLSAETAIGQYPVETVATMSRIIQEAEKARLMQRAWLPKRGSHAHAIAHAACNLTQELKVAALVVFTKSGRTAQMASKARPETPIYAVTDDPALSRRLALWWGVRPLSLPFDGTTEEMMDRIEGHLLAQELLPSGATIILVGSTPVAAQGRTNFLKVHTLRGA